MLVQAQRSGGGVNSEIESANRARGSEEVVEREETAPSAQARARMQRPPSLITRQEACQHAHLSRTSSPSDRDPGIHSDLISYENPTPARARTPTQTSTFLLGRKPSKLKPNLGFWNALKPRKMSNSMKSKSLGGIWISVVGGCDGGRIWIWI